MNSYRRGKWSFTRSSWHFEKSTATSLKTKPTNKKSSSKKVTRRTIRYTGFAHRLKPFSKKRIIKFMSDWKKHKRELKSRRG